MKEFKFVVDVDLDDYTRSQFHETLANILINKYGKELINEVIPQIENELT